MTRRIHFIRHAQSTHNEFSFTNKVGKYHVNKLGLLSGQRVSIPCSSMLPWAKLGWKKHANSVKVRSPLKFAELVQSLQGKSLRLIWWLCLQWLEPYKLTPSLLQSLRYSGIDKGCVSTSTVGEGCCQPTLPREDRQRLWFGKCKGATEPEISHFVLRWSEWSVVV